MPTLSPSYSVQDLSTWDDAALSKDGSPPRLSYLRQSFPACPQACLLVTRRACEVESISPDNALGCWQKMLQRTALESPSSGLAGLGTHTCLWTRAWHPAQFCKVPTCSDFPPYKANDSNCSHPIFIKVQNQAQSDIPI